MTLNGEMALILRYFTKFGSFQGALRKSYLQSHNYGQFSITMSSSKRLQRDRATPPLCYITARWKFCRLADAKIQDFMRSTCQSIV